MRKLFRAHHRAAARSHLRLAPHRQGEAPLLCRLLGKVLPAGLSAQTEGSVIFSVTVGEVLGLSGCFFFIIQGTLSTAPIASQASRLALPVMSELGEGGAWHLLLL